MAADGVAVNKIVVVHPGEAPAVVADRVSDPNHPTADAPQSWDYYLINWTAPGITFARVQTGGCGCGSFDMQMQSAFSATINPATEVVTTLTADTACPLSNVGSGLQSVCFASNTTGGTDAIRLMSGGVRHTYPMSGANVAGNAVFSPTAATVAYETIPISQDSCGVALTPTLHVLTFANGAAISANAGDFTPAAWAPDGSIYGQLERNSWSDNWVVAVNPATFAVTRLTATPYPAPASTPRPSGSACGRRAATRRPVKGMTGIRAGSTLREASEASPRASPPRPAAAVPGESHPGQRSRPG